MAHLNEPSLLQILPNGDVELETGDLSVMRRAMTAYVTPGLIETFDFVHGAEEYKVIGTVTATQAGGPHFRFTVRAEQG
jgi:hypothetical protein